MNQKAQELQVWNYFTDVNGLMISSFSEILAITPYLLRSLRIQKMFEAREHYYMKDEIPKAKIKKWNEARILKIFFAIMTVIALIDLTLGSVSEFVAIDFPIKMPNYNSVSSAMINRGKFEEVSMQAQVGESCVLISFLNFF